MKVLLFWNILSRTSLVYHRWFIVSSLIIIFASLIHSGSINPGLDDNLPGGAEVNQFDMMGTNSSSNFTISGTSQYFSSLRTDYQWRLIPNITTLGNPGSNLTLFGQTVNSASANLEWRMFYKIDIKVNPCRDFSLTGGRNENCCNEANQANCQDQPIDEGIVGGTDLLIAYFQNAHIPTCKDTPFEFDPNCGTYIEVHRAEEAATEAQKLQVLADVKLEQNTSKGYSTAYVDTTALCAGKYQLWWVVRTRSGPYVQFVKPFFISSPSCS